MRIMRRMGIGTGLVGWDGLDVMPVDGRDRLMDGYPRRVDSCEYEKFWEWAPWVGSELGGMGWNEWLRFGALGFDFE